MRTSLLAMLLPLALSGCEDEPRFLSLRDLCTELAVDVCEARSGGCCAGADLMVCQAGEVGRCMAELATYVSESATPRAYDAVLAAEQRNLARASLDQCGPLPNFSRFFVGGLAVGSPCERATQCATGQCAGEPRLCVEPTPAPLCAQP